MGQDWKLLAEAIRGARKARGWTQGQLADAAGIGFSTVQRLESGKPYETMPLTIDRVERALGWAPGSAGEILAGGAPRPLPDDAAAAQASSAPTRSGLPPRVQFELAEGEVFDYDVIELTEGGGKIIVLSMHSPSRTPEDAQRQAEDAREWTRVQRKLRGLLSEQDRSDP